MTKEKEILKQNKEKYESQIALIKTQREYEAITNEIAQINEKLEMMEEEELNAFQETEEMNRVIEEHNKLHEELKETIGIQDKEVNKLLDEKKKESS